MKKVIYVIVLVAMLVPLTAVMAEETSPYLSGSWFQDENNHYASVFAVGNPTNLLLRISFAIFAEDGTFCGCDTFTLPANGSRDFTIVDMDDAGKLIDDDTCGTGPSGPIPCFPAYPTAQRQTCENADRGMVKAIAYLGCTPLGQPPTSKPCTSLYFGDAIMAGWEGYLKDGNAKADSTFSMKAVTINKSTQTDMYKNVYLPCFNLVPNPH